MVRIRGLAVSGLLAVFAGCGPSMGQVDGKVVWDDGKPAAELVGSEVVFEAVAGGLSARGTVTKEGTFRLRTNQTDDGAPVGEYKVLVVENQQPGPAEGTMMPRLLDSKFRDFKTSGLTASVKSGTTPLTLTVTKVAGKN